MSPSTVVSLALVAGLGCSRSPERARGDQESRTMPSSSSSSVTLVSMGTKLEKPPVARVMLDVRLRNEATEARWFLLPDYVGSSPAKAAGIVGAAVYWLGSGGTVSVGDFSGLPGFWALLLPAGGDVRVRGLPIGARYADLSRGTIALEVVIARDFSVGGEPPSAWFGGDPTTAAHADVLWSKDHVRKSRDNPGFKGVAVAITEERRLTISVAVDRTE